MKKIKIIVGDDLNYLQKNIDKWIDDKKPYIDSISSITLNPGEYSSSFMIAILYSESSIDASTIP
jgi:hypothetical protein